jgi:hypothetical protein
MSRSIFRVRTPGICASCSRTTRSMRCCGCLKGAQERLADRHGRYVPLALKIAPDLVDAQIQAIADLLREHRMDGVIATNTTVARSGVEDLPNAGQAGGLSGAPLRALSTAVVSKLSAALAGEVAHHRRRRHHERGRCGRKDGGRCRAGPVLHRLHLSWSDTDRRSRGGDRPGAPLPAGSDNSTVLECARSTGDNRTAANRPASCPREP